MFKVKPSLEPRLDEVDAAILLAQSCDIEQCLWTILGLDGTELQMGDSKKDEECFAVVLAEIDLFDWAVGVSPRWKQEFLPDLLLFSERFPKELSLREN